MLNLYSYYSPVCNATKRSANVSGFNALADPCLSDHIVAYLNRMDVRNALHVSPKASLKWTSCSDIVNNNYACDDTLNSLVSVYDSLATEFGLKLLVFSG